MKDAAHYLLDFLMLCIRAMSLCILFCLSISVIMEHFILATVSIIAFIISIKYKNKSTKGK